MTKMIAIALSVLLIVGISYQAKRVYDQHHGSVAGNTAGNGNGTSTALNGTNSQNPNQTVGTNGTTAPDGVNGTTVGANGANSQGTGTTGGMNTAGTSTTHGTTSGDATKPVAKAEPEKPKDNCFAFEYRHKKEAKDQDIENFLDYTNAFPVARADYNPKSLCVKVNQKAVNFQVAKAKSGTTEVRVGSMVGPESVIRVSYCVGKISPCHETCVQPKKRFMDDLMNDAGDEDSFTDSWGKDGDDKNKKELKEKSKELRAVASENDHLNEGSVQRDWDELQKQEWVCK